MAHAAYVVAKIVNNGMGGFLCPPNHPKHTKSVIWREFSPHSRVFTERNSNYCSLSHALDADYFSPSIKEAVQALFDEWEQGKFPLEHPEIQAWICQVLGYFRRCYADNGSRHADKLTIDDRDPMTCIDTHAGVLLIRDFYPNFVPTAEHFRTAKWGK